MKWNDNEVIYYKYQKAAIIHKKLDLMIWNKIMKKRVLSVKINRTDSFVF